MKRNRVPDALLAFSASVVITSAAGAVEPVQLPVACFAGACGANVASFVTGGQANLSQAGNTLTVNQLTDTAILNWQSFNVSADGTVTFNQPDVNSVALNRIFQNEPSRIFGSVNANGRLYLINQNGIVFGAGSQVNVGGLVASSLNITQEALEDGIARAVAKGAPAFSLFKDAGGADLASGAVEVQQGAKIKTGNGGQVLLFGPATVAGGAGTAGVSNSGIIETPGGQTVLAAGDSIYIMPSAADPNLRGLVVEVGAGGTATNAATGQISAERGNVTLVGLAVNQLGRVSATTSVSENGSIYLRARDSVEVGGDAANPSLEATRAGTLEVGAASRTEVTLSGSTETTVDINEQRRSTVEMVGEKVHLGKHATVIATGGNVSISARSDLTNTNIQALTPGGAARLVVEEGVNIDVSGANIELAMERNLVRAELRGNELRNSPLQRDGALRGQAVYFDIRRTGTRADGTSWQGTPLGDVSGQISGIQRDVRERNLEGGTISLGSQNESIIAPGASFNLSGGSIRYLDGYLNTTKLLAADGSVVDIGAASPDRLYTGTTSSGYSVTYERWGVTKDYPYFIGASQRGTFERGYLEGKDAGSLTVVSPRLIFDGTVKANVVVGLHQRLPSTPQSADAGALPMYRPYNEVPLGARLDLGAANPFINGAGLASYGAPSIELAAQALLPTLRNAAGDAFDPLKDPWPEDLNKVWLSTKMLDGSGVTRLGLYSNGTVTVAPGQTLALPAGGEISIAAGAVSIGGRIDVPSGSINIAARPTIDTETTPSLFLSESAQLTARGSWVNDNPLLAGAGTAPLWIDGGSISLSTVRADLTTAKGSLLDVSAGAYRKASGGLTLGRGGDINVASSGLVTTEDGGRPARLSFGSEVRSFSLGQGGTLKLGAPGICIGDTGCLDDPAYLSLGASFFSQGGFSAFDITSTQFDARITAGTTLDLRARNWEITSDVSRLASGTDLTSIVTETTLPLERRAPVDFSLSAMPSRTANDAFFENSNFATLGKLVMEQGSLINADPGASVSLRTTTSLFMDGSISAPGGSVSLGISSTPATISFLEAQAVWLGAQSRIDVAGVSLIQPNSVGRRVGDVLDGGKVTIDADRGYVVAAQGSVIDISGTSGVVDVRAGSSSKSPYISKTVASAGGVVDINAAEGMFLNGEFLAHSGAPGEVAAGSLSFTLDAQAGGNRRADPLTPINDVPTPVFPTGPRTFTLSQHLSPVSLGAGGAIPLSMNGHGYLSADQIERSGADSVTLVTRSISDGPRTTAASIGTIELAGDLSLSVGRRLVLDAPAIIGNGGKVDLTAPYLAIGSGDLVRRETIQLGNEALSGSLTLNAQLFDVLGHSTLSGFRDVKMAVDGDIRLRGTQGENQRELTGSLTSNAGTLDLSAHQIYPTTLSKFDVNLVGDVQNTLRIGSTGTGSTPLSAGGALTLRADRVEQAGTLRAPFGSIVIQAPEVELMSGSVTSTSGAGATVPFGSTQGGLSWAYQLDQQTLIFGSAENPLPEQRISLEGDRVLLNSGAVLDVSGGGDLLAQEYVPGVTGTNDVLSATLSPDTYAIVPTLGSTFAPYDPQSYVGSRLKPGDSVYLEAGSGLPAGNYALLPARYATVPGAYLVTVVKGYQDIAAGETIGRIEGGSVVAGRFTFGNGALGASRTQGFYVRAGDLAQKSARYDVTSANKFFSELASLSAAARLPRDAGVVSVLASDELSLQGQLKAAADAGGRGATLELSAQNLAITANDGVSSAPDGFLAVSAQDLSALGAQTLVIGGRITAEGSKSVVTASAANVLIDSGAVLVGPEILAVAHDSIVVESGASITGRGAATVSAVGDGTVKVAENDSLLRVSSLGQIDIERAESVVTAGNIDVRSGSVVGATGSVLFDSAGDTFVNGRLDAAGASIYFGAGQISLGAADAATPGLVLSESQLAPLGNSQLVFASRGSVDIFGDLTLNASALTFDTGTVRRMSGSGTASFTADEVAFRGAGASGTPSLAAAGDLKVVAKTVSFDGGNTLLDGFSSVGLGASEGLAFNDDGSFSVIGALTLDTPMVSTAAGVDGAISASGVARLINSAGTAASAGSAGLGGSLTVSADSIEAGTLFALPSGHLQLSAKQGGISLTDSARIDLAGRSATFDDQIVATGGGSLSLVAEAGGVSMANGARVDVSSGGAHARAGSVKIVVPTGAVDLRGTLLGSAADVGLGGAFTIDAAALPDLTALNALLNTGGFDRARSFRMRGPGSLTLEAGDGNAIRAASVMLQADQGSINVNGSILARAAVGGGASVGLFASDNINVSGLIDVVAGAGASSRVDLGSTNGNVALNSGSSVAFSGGARSELWLRMSRANVETLADADASNDRLVLAGTVTGADRTTLEGVKSYDADLAGGLDANTSTASALYTEAATFMTTAANVAAALSGKLGGGNARLLAGIELTSTGDMTLSQDWNLSDWRFGADQTPGVLTLRAGGNLLLNNSLSDGFATATTEVLTNTSSTWSYRLVGGADLGAANMLSTQSSFALPVDGNNATIGNVKIGGDSGRTVVRTGDGFIDVAAANDITLGNQRSVLYTAGRVSPGTFSLPPINNPSTTVTIYPTDGGNISLTAGNDVIAAASDQLINNWLWRAGGPANQISPTTADATGWTVNFGRFQQGVGALAGGDVTVAAGRDIVDLSVSIPTVGRQVGGIRPTNSVVEVINGGNMNVSSGGDIRGGVYFAGGGTALIDSGGAVSAGGNGLNTILALGDASVTLNARRDLTVEAIVNPTLVTQAAQNAQAIRQSFFSTYGADSGVDLLSTAGTLSLINDKERIKTVVGSMTFNDNNDAGLTIYPPSLRATAFEGDVSVRGSMLLMPSAQGNLELFAGHDVQVGGFENGAAADIVVSDSDPALWPSITTPIRALDPNSFVRKALFASNPEFHSAVPVHTGEGLHGGRIENDPVRVVARTGDIVFDLDRTREANPSVLHTPKATRLVAGRDIVNVNLFAQNLGVGDVTLVSAGRDVIYPIVRSDIGEVRTTTREISVSGPGYLQVDAGRDIDLQTSGGITTRGDLTNPGLADTGASVEVTAGLNGKGRSVDAFMDAYLTATGLYAQDIIDFVAQVTGNRPATAADAVAQFRALPAETRLPLINRVLVAELRRVGREAAKTGSQDFRDAYKALNTLFPGSNPDLDAGEKNAYAGDVKLFFSRVYTLDSGDISVFAPGGLVNVGLATPPAAFGLPKEPSELGMVVQGSGSIHSVSFGDFAVNESRVFATDGGNILVWATRGDIDAGRGAKTAISAPAPVITFDINGNPKITISPALAGSGIQTIATTPGRKPGDVDLFAPRGVVNAGDAGIVAGNLTIAATAVLGANNISVSGTSTGVPVDTGGIGNSLPTTNTNARTASSATDAALLGDGDEKSKAPLADSALGWLEVFIEGFGGDVCKPSDVTCLERQKKD